MHLSRTYVVDRDLGQCFSSLKYETRHAGPLWLGYNKRMSVTMGTREHNMAFSLGIGAPN